VLSILSSILSSGLLSGLLSVVLSVSLPEGVLSKHIGTDRASCSLRQRGSEMR
jgi:hypothetical protein